MGGPFASRAEQPVRVARVEWWMTATGELDMNRYGEPAGLRPFGLEVDGVTIATRQRWEVLRASSQDEVEGHESGRREESVCRLSSPPWSSVNNCTAAAALPTSEAATADPWSRCIARRVLPRWDVDAGALHLLRK